MNYKTIAGVLGVALLVIATVPLAAARQSDTRSTSRTTIRVSTNSDGASGGSSVSSAHIQITEQEAGKPPVTFTYSTTSINQPLNVTITESDNDIVVVPEHADEERIERSDRDSQQPQPPARTSRRSVLSIIMETLIDYAEKIFT